MLSEFNRLIPSNKRAVLNAMAFASRFRRESQYDRLLEQCSVATGISSRPLLLVKLMEDMSSADGGELTDDSDYNHLHWWCNNRAARRNRTTTKSTVTAAVVLAVAMMGVGTIGESSVDNAGTRRSVDIGSLLRADIGSLLGRKV